MKVIVYIVIFFVVLTALYCVENDSTTNKGQKAVVNVIASAVISSMFTLFFEWDNSKPDTNLQQPVVTTEYSVETEKESSAETKPLISETSQLPEEMDTEETPQNDDNANDIVESENDQESSEETNGEEKDTGETEQKPLTETKENVAVETTWPEETTRTVAWPVAYSESVQSVEELNGIVGSLSEMNTADRYRFSVNTDGIYGFNTDLTSGGSVSLKLYSSNGERLKEGSNQLNLNLRAGETYTLEINRKKNCEYTLFVGIPTEETDVSGKNSFGGQMTYYGQDDAFWYTAEVGGQYRLETDCSSGGAVRIKVKGENGAVLKSADKHMSVTLEAGKRYIFSIEYKNPCSYTVLLGIPKPMRDITCDMYASGEITYVDQVDRYQFTAEYDGRYEFTASTDEGVAVQLAVEGENGSVLKKQRKHVSIDLSEGKTYVLCVGYASGVGAYNVDIE